MNLLDYAMEGSGEPFKDTSIASVTGRALDPLWCVIVTIPAVEIGIENWKHKNDFPKDIRLDHVYLNLHIAFALSPAQVALLVDKFFGKVKSHANVRFEKSRQSRFMKLSDIQVERKMKPRLRLKTLKANHTS